MYRYRFGMGDVNGGGPPPIATVQAPPCPAGYGVPTFQGGISSALANLPGSLWTGPLYLASSFGGGSNPGNVLAPGAAAAGVETACFQAQRETMAHSIGLALPGLVVIGGALMLLFGGKGGRRG